ncbi:MAG: PEP-CTERM sorting domain-containing protein [Pirellulales bacterium]|nr:PEP-CTERM sorting domain-containing protein [Pirellulales bacterium]
MFRLTLTVAAVAAATTLQWLCATGPAAATVIAADDFQSYTLGTIIDQGTSGDGWTGSWTGLNSTSSLAVPIRDVSAGVMPGFGQSLEVGFSALQPNKVPTNNNILQRQFDPQTGTVYVGFALKTVGFENGGVGTSAGDMMQIYVNNTSNETGTAGSQNDALSCGVDFAPPPDGDNGAYFVRAGGGDSQVPTAFLHTNDVVHRLVMRLSLGGLFNNVYDEVALFVDQDSEGTPDAQRFWSDIGDPAIMSLSVLHMRVWGMELEDRIYLDSLCIATTYAEALPEIPDVDLPGDADGNGKVDKADAARLAANWLRMGDATWGQGDFNNDRNVDDLDLAILAANWTPEGPAAAVPEPSVVALLLAAAVVIALRRRGR